jgi:hypothetical protein
VVAIFLILPLFSGIRPDASVSGTCESSPVSSRKLHACTTRGEDGSASDTRRCLSAVEDEDAGNGALNENVEAEGTLSCGLFGELGAARPPCDSERLLELDAAMCADKMVCSQASAARVSVWDKIPLLLASEAKRSDINGQQAVGLLGMRKSRAVLRLKAISRGQNAAS